MITSILETARKGAIVREVKRYRARIFHLSSVNLVWQTGTIRESLKLEGKTTKLINRFG